MSKFKEEQKVYITNLHVYKAQNPLANIVKEMMEFSSKESTISKIFTFAYDKNKIEYLLHTTNSWRWSEDLLLSEEEYNNRDVDEDGYIDNQL